MKITKDNLISMGVDEDIAEDYLQVRKDKRSTLTGTALKAIIREAEKGGYSLTDALTICIEKNWIGFKSEWIEKRLVVDDFVLKHTDKSWRTMLVEDDKKLIN